MPGRYFDEWQVGDRIAHEVTRTVTETDNVLISALTHNPQPMHLDHEAAAKSEFGKPLVNSVYTFGLMIGVSVADTTLGTLVANLGYGTMGGLSLWSFFYGQRAKRRGEARRAAALAEAAASSGSGGGG